MKHAPSRRDWLASAAGGLLSLAWPASGADPVAPTPQDGSWTDAARQRALPWRLRLPGAPGTAAMWPLVVYSHGLGGSREGGALWGEAWAAAGVAVLHLEHLGSNTAAAHAGLRQLRKAASAEQLRARVADVRFALDQLQRLASQGSQGSKSWAALRLDAVGVAGHSFGAHTTQAVAGQRYAVAAEVVDPRPKAFVALSPSAPAGERMGLQTSLGGITRPFMVVTGSLDGDPLGGHERGEPRAAVYDGLPPGQRALLWLDGADHMTLGGGRPSGVGTRTLRRRPEAAAEGQAAHQAIVAQITALWWRAHLLGDAAARSALQRPQGLGAKDRFVLG